MEKQGSGGKTGCLRGAGNEEACKKDGERKRGSENNVGIWQRVRSWKILIKRILKTFCCENAA